MLVGLLQRIVLPDLQLFKPGEAPRWVEVKYKDHADKYQKLQQWQHGIDCRIGAHMQVQELTGMSGRLSIVQCKPGKEADPYPVHLWQELNELKQHVQVKTEPHATFHRGVAYFPLDAFRCSPITFEMPADLPQLAHNVNPWERKWKQGIAPQWPIRFCDESPFERGEDAPPLFRAARGAA